MKCTMDKRQAGIDLIICKLLGNITPKQEIELNNWVDQSAENKRIYEKLCSTKSLLDKKVSYDSIDTNAAYNAFLKQIGYKRSIKKYFLQYSRYAIAGIVLLLIAIGTYFMIKPDTSPDLYADLNKIANRESQAILILDNGYEVSLNSANGSEKIVVSDSSIINNEDNKIDYTQTISREDGAYNTLITPPGKEYSIILSDGTIVHLNSASKLKYPVNFKREVREVVLEGEGYFTIAKDSKRPFIVYTKGIQVRQYGTIFNINTHSSDKVEIVLVEGSIGIAPPNSAPVIMKPYQFAEYNEVQQSLSVKDVDIEPYISWHHGELIFENKTMEEIMNTLSLWYGIDIIIDNKNIKKLHFTGRVNRYDKIDYILKAMERVADVKFNIKDNKVYVTQYLK